MELRQLRSLVALVESDFSVSRAAARLHLVQPAVSQHLKRLEQELGTRLIQRRGKRLLGLTEAGERVLGHARAALADTASILAVGRDYRSLSSKMSHFLGRFLCETDLRLGWFSRVQIDDFLRFPVPGWP